MAHIINNLLIIKVGTSTLTKRTTDGYMELDTAAFVRIAEQITTLRASGQHMLIVSSAAITAGMVATNTKHRPTRDAMPALQSLASIGWRHILNTWSTALHDDTIGELLLTRRELELPHERQEVLRVIYHLLSDRRIAIINENDAITHEEISYGDNDMLAALLASAIKHSNLFGDDISVVVLSDVDGVLRDPDDPDSVIREITDTQQYVASIRHTTSDGGTGGMASKFAAAQIAQRHGVEFYIAHGRKEDILERTLSKTTGTHFVSER